MLRRIRIYLTAPRVEVTLATHDAGGVTEKDIDLAIFMDELASS